MSVESIVMAPLSFLIRVICAFFLVGLAGGLLIFYCLFIFEKESGGRAKGETQNPKQAPHYQCRALCGAQSHDCETMTRAEIKLDT